MAKARRDVASSPGDVSVNADESGTVARPRPAPERFSEPPRSLLTKLCPECRGHYPADFRVCPRDATPLEDAPEASDPLLGKKLANTYEIVAVLGEGGMGRVYEARHVRLSGKRYAVKMLHEELARQPEVVTRFQREAEAASALVHPNVVGVFDVNHTNDGRPYIVQELLEGEELGVYLDRVERLPGSAAVYIVRNVCHALTAAHARGIIHRDMKPENVFLVGSAEAPTVKVLDFGISKIGESAQSLTKTGVVLGTPAYMAPEQARGDKVDERADVYAVGAILYRAVTGRKPFENLDPMATLSAVLVDEPPRPCALEPGLPPTLELVIQRAMAKKPAERYPSMAALEADLVQFDTGGLGTEAAALGGVAVSPPRTIITSPGETSSDPSARTVLARAPAPSMAGSEAEVTRSVRFARPAIVMHTAMGMIALLAGVVDAVAAAIRMASQGRTELTMAEITLTLVGALAALVTPAFLWVRHLRKSVWSSSPRAIAVAERMRNMLLLAAAAYGVTALFVHVLEVVVRRDASGIAWPGWNMVLFLVSASVAAASWFGPGLLRRN
ncbi:MAG TPA: serine/threonine-protein kinase [Polyangiaceae bacterium]